MHSRKRTAADAQLPIVNQLHKRPMYTQTLPSRRNAQGQLVGDAPEGDSLLNRWVALFGDTVRTIWYKSKEFANRVIPVDNFEAIPEANIPLPPSPPLHPLPSFPIRPPIPQFSLTPEDSPRDVSTLPPPHQPVASTSQAAGFQLDDVTAVSSVTQPRLNYPKHIHIHQAQHQRKVEERNKREFEKLRTRKTSSSVEMDMAKAYDRIVVAQMLEQRQQSDRQWFSGSLSGSQTGNIRLQPYSSLPEKAVSGDSRSRSLIDRRGSFNLERALQIAHQTMNAPRPPRPSFDKFRIFELEKDREIDRRIRQATRLPTKLPPQIMKDIEQLRAKRGVVATFAREAIKDVDIARLNPQGPDQWLNDEVINFYGAILLDRAQKYMANKNTLVNGTAKKKKGKTPEFLNIHYFNTYLYPKIPKYSVFRLNRWTKQIDIFSKDYVFIPVNHGNVHWTLSAINFRKKRVESYDSMGHYRPEVYGTLRKYLELEHQDKKMKPFNFTDWVDHFDENIPKQENGYDCGVFTCQFMESLSRGVEEFAFDQSDMVYIRNRMTWEIGKGRMWEESDSRGSIA